MVFVDLIFGVILFLNLTGLFRFLSPQLGLGFQTLGIVLIAAHLSYLVLRSTSTLALLQKRFVQVWLFLLLVWPAATAVYSPAPPLREIGLRVYFTSLMVGAAVFVSVQGWDFVRKLVGVSIAVSLVGLLLSLMAPGYFEGVAQMIESGSASDIEEMKQTVRAFGFFLQPNRASAIIILLFVFWWPDPEGRSDLKLIGSGLVMAGAVALTASRSSLLVAFMCGGAAYWYHTKHSVRAGSGSATVRALKTSALIVVITTAVFGLSDQAARMLGQNPEESFATRISFLTDIDGTEDLAYDESVRERLRAQRLYMRYIEEAPFLGYGISTSQYFIRQGRFTRSPHNVFLAVTFEFGTLYLLVLVGAFGWVLLRKTRKRLARNFRMDVCAVFVVYVLTMGMALGGLFHLRPFYCVLGFLAAAQAYPDHIPSS